MSDETKALEVATVRMDLTFSQLADAFVASGFFPDIKTKSQAIVKMQAGRELGFTPFASLKAFHVLVFERKDGTKYPAALTMDASAMRALVRRSGKYSYEVTESTDRVCRMQWFMHGKFQGDSEFTIEEARRRQTKNLDKFPQDMLFARATGRGVRQFCPDVLMGPVYSPEEMRDAEFEIIEPQAEATPEPKPARAGPQEAPGETIPPGEIHFTPPPPEGAPEPPQAQLSPAERLRAQILDRWEKLADFARVPKEETTDALVGYLTVSERVQTKELEDMTVAELSALFNGLNARGDKGESAAWRDEAIAFLENWVRPELTDEPA